MASDTTKTAKADKTVKADAKASAKPVKSSGKSTKAAASEPNFFERIAKYFNDVRVEMKRVVWPDREEVLQSSLVVVVALVFFIVYVSLWDQVASFVFITLPNMIMTGGK